MSVVRNQTTLRGPCTISGRGFWSGKINTLTFLPAPAGTGVRFYRDDLLGQGVLAVTENCQGMSLRTCLGIGFERFDMIEHVMAALAGMQIDNVQVHCTDREMPSLDGSCFPLVVALQSVGKVSLRSRCPVLRVTEPIRVGNAQQWISIEPAERFEIEYRLDYGSESPIKKSTYSSIVTEENFAREISPARTFVTRAEADLLQGRGLAKHVTERDLLVFGPDGPANNQLRFSDECARHKALDLLGDLAVIGVDLVGKVIANRSGHQLNAELARKLRVLYLSHSQNLAAA
jgi:UDP-3-O-[3-hydroxymyristoyl] N-acetylglucosamine deacetylase/UDP-3-O-[3-hydroxymyristoyl] N-acetylglucosamine deacetylase/3-hydroxyacyl-[acyl-carrier-protein] dehydratase